MSGKKKQKTEISKVFAELGFFSGDPVAIKIWHSRSTIVFRVLVKDEEGKKWGPKKKEKEKF